jgi:uncharacterized protein YndB with AHSA1/START domain
MPEGEVIVTCLVAVSLDDAFLIFTQGIDRWWVRIPGQVEDTVVRFEGDRLVAATANGTQLLATVAKWSPPVHLEMQWSGPHAHPGDTVTIDFHPEGDATRVTIRHRRSGLRPEETTAAILGLWWGDLLARLARQVLTNDEPPD